MNVRNKTGKKLDTIKKTASFDQLQNTNVSGIRRNNLIRKLKAKNRQLIS